MTGFPFPFSFGAASAPELAPESLTPGVGGATSLVGAGFVPLLAISCREGCRTPVEALCFMNAK